jgi:hypothetical protein
MRLFVLEHPMKKQDKIERRLARLETLLATGDGGVNVVFVDNSNSTRYNPNMIVIDSVPRVLVNKNSAPPSEPE